MSKHKLLLLALGAAAVGGGYYYVSRNGGLSKVKADLKARLTGARAAAAATSVSTSPVTLTVGPVEVLDEKDTES